MTLEQIALVQRSFAQLLPNADVAAAVFYHRLFELDPALRPLFKGDPQAQERALMGMLKVAVAGLDRLDQLVPAVQSLGRRHAGYGVQDAHYATVGGALLWTLHQGLGDAFTTAVEQAWVTVYTLLADVMKGAANVMNDEIHPTTRWLQVIDI